MRRKLWKIAVSLCMACICSISVSGCGGSEDTITYEFTGTDAKKAGYAEGTITFQTSEIGTYNLYWSDDVGALDGYYEIAQTVIDEENTKAEVVF